MIKHDLVTVLTYSDEMTFEEVTKAEQLLVGCIESILTKCKTNAFSHESTENSFMLRCELLGILPLHFIRDMAKAIAEQSPHGVECRILLYSSSLSVIKGAVCKEGEYKLQSLDAVQSIGHRKIYDIPQENIKESQIFS